MAEIFHNDITMDFPGAKNINGKTSVVLFLKRIFSNYENINFKISEAFYSGNKICVAWENNGIRKNGDVYQNRGMTLMRLNNNKIIYLSDYFKNTEIAQVGQSK
jgi:ketosteroid isomerase-like protein